MTAVDRIDFLCLFSDAFSGAVVTYGRVVGWFLDAEMERLLNVTYFKALIQHLSRGTEEIKETFGLGLPAVSGREFRAWICRMRRSSCYFSW